jgi:hypothetical protein
MQRNILLSSVMIENLLSHAWHSYKQYLIQSECSVLSTFCYAVLHNNRYTLLSENVSLYFLLHQVFFVRSSRYFFFTSSYALLYTFISKCDCTSLQCCHKGCMQSNQQLALSRLMHSIYRGSAVFPYQALESRQVKETLIGCAELHNVKKFKTLNIYSVCVCVCMYIYI